jgi:hypothetical protein
VFPRQGRGLSTARVPISLRTDPFGGVDIFDQNCRMHIFYLGLIFNIRVDQHGY